MGSRTWISGMAAVAAAAALFAAPAQADSASIYLNIGGPSYDYGYSQPGYVYSQPGYGYAQPYGYTQPYGYSQPYGYAQPAYVYTQPGYSTYGQARHRRHLRDSDRDGTPDRWDRDRDGDGVPNRFDRRPDNPYRY